MLQFVQSLYLSQDPFLTGECLFKPFNCISAESLLIPLKGYNRFFAEKREGTKGYIYVAWIVAHVVSGIFAYPLFGALAGIGMLLKLPGVYFLYKHNEAEKASHLNPIRANFKSGVQFADSQEASVEMAGWELVFISVHTMTAEDYLGQCTSIENAIDEQTTKLRNVYLSHIGGKNDRSSGMTVNIHILKRIHA